VNSYREAVSWTVSTARGKVNEFPWELWAELVVGLIGCHRYRQKVNQKAVFSG